MTTFGEAGASYRRRHSSVGVLGVGALVVATLLFLLIDSLSSASSPTRARLSSASAHGQSTTVGGAIAQTSDLAIRSFPRLTFGAPGSDPGTAPALTAQQAFDDMSSNDGPIPNSITAYYGSLSDVASIDGSPVLPASSPSVYAFSAASPCPSGDDAEGNQAAQSCTEWTFADANTGAMLWGTWIPKQASG